MIVKARGSSRLSLMPLLRVMACSEELKKKSVIMV
jgi:hypothetical protein